MKEAFKPLADPTNSESYAIWGSLGVKLVSQVWPNVMVPLDKFAGFVSEGSMTGQMFLAGVITYGVMRMTSKAAKAKKNGKK